MLILISKIESNQSSNQEDHNSHLSSDRFFEPLSSYINLYIHRRGSSDTFECERCSLNGDIHFMKEHPCKNDLTLLNK